MFDEVDGDALFEVVERQFGPVTLMWLVVPSNTVCSSDTLGGDDFLAPRQWGRPGRLR